MPWTRRIGVALALLLLVGAGIALAGNALDAVPGDSAVSPSALPPAAPVLTTPDGSLTRRGHTDIAGTLPEGLTNGAHSLRVYVNGELEREREAPTRLDFTISDVALSEGANEIEVALVGPGGESAKSPVLTISRDTTPPEIVVARPEPNAVVYDPIVTLRGSTEPGASLSIREPGAAREIDAIVGADGRFAAEVHLGMGANRFVLRSEDPAGNRSTSDFEISRSSSQGSVTLSLSVDELAAAELPRSIDVLATVRDEHGNASDGAEVVFGLSPPNRGTTTYRATTSNGTAVWEDLIINGDQRATGEWLITVLVTLASGEELRSLASLSVR